MTDEIRTPAGGKGEAVRFKLTNIATGETTAFATEREAQDFVASQSNPRMWVILAVQVPA